MWIFTNKSFLSIVQDVNSPENLLVRSRQKQDILNVFPSANVYQTNPSDYQYRANISKNDVANALVDQIAKIDYPNFKNSLNKKDLTRKSAYTSIWGVLADRYGTNCIYENF